MISRADAEFLRASLRTRRQPQDDSKTRQRKTALFNEAFSLNPPKADVSRLRLAEDDGSKTYENLHRGARAFAEGLYAAIRNPGMHAPEKVAGGEEQLRLEQLAAFSILARWVDQADVETA